jgi:hypothetical protein
LTNNGVIDFSTNANTAGAGITFTGATDNSFNFGGGSTTDFQQAAGLTINKGTNNTPVLTFNPGGTITVIGANTVGFLTITNGTFKLAGSGAFSNPVFNVAAYSIPSTGGFWMNNANATVVGQNGNATITGLFRMTLGTFNIGTATGNALGFASGSNINIEGGIISSTGRFGVTASGNAITYNQTGGTITVCTIGNASTTLGSFDLGTGVGIYQHQRRNHRRSARFYRRVRTAGLSQSIGSDGYDNSYGRYGTTWQRCVRCGKSLQHSGCVSRSRC